MPSAERIDEAAGELTTAVHALDGIVSMLKVMPVGVTLEPACLAALLFPVLGNVSAALDNVS